MATDKSVNIIIAAKDRSAKAFGAVKGRLSSLAKSVFNLKTAIAGALGGVAIGSLAKESLEAFKVQEDAEARLLQSLKNRNLATQENISSLKSAASALQRFTTIGDETSISVQATALSMGASVQQAILLTRASANLASGMNIGIDQAARQLTKTLGGFAGELGEILPELKNLTREQLQAGAAIDLIDEKFSGFAANQATTFSGAMAQASNAIGDVKERIGQALAPAILSLSNTITKFAPTLERFAIGFAGKFSFIASAVKKSVQFIGSVFKSMAVGIVTAFTTITFVARNWKDGLSISFKLVQLAALGLFNDVSYFFTDVIPPLLKWFARNWKALIVDSFVSAQTVIVNFSKNVTAIIGEIFTYVTSLGEKGFEDGVSETLKRITIPLLDGFKATAESLPEILGRSITDKETELTNDLANMYRRMSGKLSKEIKDNLFLLGLGDSSPLANLVQASPPSFDSILSNADTTRGPSIAGASASKSRRSVGGATLEASRFLTGVSSSGNEQLQLQKSALKKSEEANMLLKQTRDLIKQITSNSTPIVIGAGIAR